MEFMETVQGEVERKEVVAELSRSGKLAAKEKEPKEPEPEESNVGFAKHTATS